MTTIAITLENVCEGGNHLDVGYTRDGGPMRLLHLHDEVLREEPTPEEIDAAIAVLLRSKSYDKTAEQAHDALLAGITVEV